MYPLLKHLHNSIMKRYLRYLFSKYLVSCNKNVLRLNLFDQISDIPGLDLIYFDENSL